MASDPVHVAFATPHSPRLIRHVSFATSHSPRLVRHISFATSHSPRLIRHVSFATSVRDRDRSGASRVHAPLERAQAKLVPPRPISDTDESAEAEALRSVLRGVVAALLAGVPTAAATAVAKLGGADRAHAARLSPTQWTDAVLTECVPCQRGCDRWRETVRHFALTRGGSRCAGWKCKSAILRQRLDDR